MVNDLRVLLREASGQAPHDENDLSFVLRAGRRRVRTRRAAFLGGTALAAAAVVTVAALAWPGSDPANLAADGVSVPNPDAPTIHLADATRAVEGRDYRVLAAYTNKNLNRDNGQYFDGVTDDGLILFRDGPRMDQPRPRYALMDPATGEKDWLPDPDIGQTDLRPLELGADRLVFLGTYGSTGMNAHLSVYWFDRDTGRWSAMKWRDLPETDGPFGAVLGPDDRLYVPVPASHGKPPEGGWPTGPDGEAEDADAEGDTHHLWSAALTDGQDVRDEGLTIGSLAFTTSEMVWTDSTNGDTGMVHVRDLRSGEEHTFDPHAGERCNLLSFGASGDRIVMSQYCGTYDGGVRDDRVQVLTTEGEQVVTLQDSGIEGALASADGDGLVSVTSYESGGKGTYVYALGTDRFLRLTDDFSQWGMGGPTPEGQFMWTTPANDGKGSTQWLGQLTG